MEPLERPLSEVTEGVSSPIAGDLSGKRTGGNLVWQVALLVLIGLRKVANNLRQEKFDGTIEENTS